MFGYSTDLRSRTQGRGNYSMFFEKYEQMCIRDRDALNEKEQTPQVNKDTLKEAIGKAEALDLTQYKEEGKACLLYTSRCV